MVCFVTIYALIAVIAAFFVGNELAESFANMEWSSRLLVVISGLIGLGWPMIAFTIIAFGSVAIGIVLFGYILFWITDMVRE